MSGNKLNYTFAVRRDKLTDGGDLLSVLRRAGVELSSAQGDQPRNPVVFELSVAKGRATESIVRRLKRRYGIDAFSEPLQPLFDRI